MKLLIQEPSKIKIFGKTRGGGALLARWTTDFDCGYETNWWHIIKDDVYDISKLKAKRRYEITKSRKNFEVREIKPETYAEELYEVQIAAFGAYPKKYRPVVNHDEFVRNCKNWKGVCFGAFYKAGDDNKLCGYVLLFVGDKCINFSVQKTKPKFEHLGVNAALVDGILSFYELDLKAGKYIWDGERSINHETAFQEYLQKYFGFRKAYCKLHIVYRPNISGLVKICYFFRGILKRLDKIKMVHLINVVLRMEEIKRDKR